MGKLVPKFLPLIKRKERKKKDGGKRRKVGGEGGGKKWYLGKYANLFHLFVS